MFGVECTGDQVSHAPPSSSNIPTIQIWHGSERGRQYVCYFFDIREAVTANPGLEHAFPFLPPPIKYVWA